MSEPLISVRGLSVGHADRILLQNADFDVEFGDVFVILGGSGCGKSTLLRHLIGLERPRAGSIHIAGIGEPRLRGTAPEYGVMFQSGALFGSLTVGENVAFALQEWTDLPEPAIDAFFCPIAVACARREPSGRVSIQCLSVWGFASSQAAINPLNA